MTDCASSPLTAEALKKAWHRRLSEGLLYGFGFSEFLFRNQVPAKRLLGDFQFRFCPPSEAAEEKFPFPATVPLKAVIDNNRRLAGTVSHGYPIIHPNDFKSAVPAGSGIIVLGSDYGSIKKQLLSLNLKEFLDFIWCDDFAPLHHYVKNGRVVAKTLNHILLNGCNLKCRRCIFAMGQNRQPPVSLSLQAAKSDADAFFSACDYIHCFSPVGGETLMYPYLAEYLEYIGRNYRDRIRLLNFATNGAIIPKERVMAVCREYGIDIFISNYSQSGIKDYSATRSRVIGRLEKNGLRPHLIDEPDWRDFFPPDNELDQTSEGLAEHYRSCRQWRNCMGLHGGNLYYCDMSLAHYLTGNGLKNEFDFLDLKTEESDELKKKMFLNVMQILPAGHASLCRRCVGYDSRYAYRIPAGEQTQEAG